LLKYVCIARRAKGSTGQVLLQLLEMLSDNILFQLGMAPTIPGARQLVNHGHIRVNDHMVDIPSYPCKPQDVITIRYQQRLRAIIRKNLDLFQRDKLPNHLTFHSLQYKEFINQIIDSKWISFKINELLVVEYYSRQA
jgi:small subunit ribosomal protein S4